MCHETIQPRTRQRIDHMILEGVTWHARHLPSKHKFSYPYRYWGINMNKLMEEELPHSSRLFSLTKSALHKVCLTDYFDAQRLDETNSSNADFLQKQYNEKAKIEESTAVHTFSSSRKHVRDAHNWLNAVTTHMLRITGTKPEGDTLALVVTRNLGFYFSPVNFYIGFNKQGNASHLLAEVSNTPWNKSHYYGFLLDDYANGEVATFSHKKDFHVSPFNPVDQEYHWKVRVQPPKKMNEQQDSISSTICDIYVSITVKDARGKVFEAGIDLKAANFSVANIKSSIKRNPIMNFSSMMRIYIHAFKLYVYKKVPYISYNQKLKESAQKP